MSGCVSHALRLAVAGAIATAVACSGPEGFHRLGDGGVIPSGAGGGGFNSGGRGFGGSGFPGTGGSVVASGGTTFGSGGGSFSSGGRTGFGSGGSSGGSGSGGGGTAGASSSGGSPGSGGATPCTTCMLSVTYAPNGTADGQAIAGEVHISTDRAVAINQITVKYWYTNEIGSTAIITDVDYSGLSTGVGFPKPDQTASPTVSVNPTRPNANTVTSITIPETGILNPGTSLYIKFRIHESAYQGTFMMANDYSFGATQLLTMPWSKITAYVSGTKAWGDEP